ncbi:MAG: hypothetical protein P8Y23_15840, partial [Candidatus Lokiarchaeota archaeon]
MTLPEEELKFIRLIERSIGTGIPLVSDLYSYTLGYTIKDNHVEGLGLFSCELRSVPEKINVLSSLKRLLIRGNKLRVLPEELFLLMSLESLDL